MAILRSVVDVALHYGRTPRAIRNWIRAGMPRLADGRFDLAQVELWLVERRHLGASLREMALQEEIRTLFEAAALHLRRGLQEFASAYVAARGKGRIQLLDRAVRDILHGCAHQQLLLEGGGERCDEKKFDIERS
jgi:hypothetical protein